MPAKKLTKPLPRPQMIQHNVPDIDAAQRAIGVLADQAARQALRPWANQTVNLVVGDNRVIHGLGIVPHGCILTPTAADATFAWAMTSRDDKQAVITVVGVAQTGARLSFYA